MTPEQATLHDVRAEIAKLPEDDRLRIEAIAGSIRNILRADPRAAMALALVGAELAVAEGA
jgi:hypothetical protein